MCGQLLMGFCSVLQVQLDDMPYVVHAKYDPYKQCLSGTCQQIIEEITQWVNGVDDPHCILLFTGSLAPESPPLLIQWQSYLTTWSILEHLSVSQQAGRRIDWVFTTIACDLADFDQKLKCSLQNEVQHWGLWKSTHLQDQFERSILKPVMRMQDTIGSVLIMIDAWDESGDRESCKVFLKIFIRLSMSLGNLWVKWLVDLGFFVAQVCIDLGRKSAVASTCHRYLPYSAVLWFI